MRTGSSSIHPLGRRGRRRLDARVKGGRRARLHWLETEALEPRTLLSTTPAPSASGSLQDLTGIGTISGGGNANSPAIVIDPNDPLKMVAVWGVDLSTLSPTPTTTAVVQGAYSNNGGVSWSPMGNVSPAQLDPLTINSNPSKPYTQVTEPSVAFGAGDQVYVVALQTSTASDGMVYLQQYDFSGASPQAGTNSGPIYQWVTGSDAATSPTVAADAPPPGNAKTSSPYGGNVYVAWSSIDVEPANPNPFSGPGFNPNRAEMVVATPIAGASGSQKPMSFGPVQTVSAGGNFGSQRDSHLQIVVDENNGGRVTVAWDDFGTGSTASTPYDNLMSTLVTNPGYSYGFANTTTKTFDIGTTTAPSLVSDALNVSGLTDPAINDMSVKVGLVDESSVQNLKLVLVAPDGESSIVLVNNQNDSSGTANGGAGLPSGNAIGVVGFTAGQNFTPGLSVGTVFDDNATRNIYDGNTANPVVNGNTALDYVGYFRPEGGSLRQFLQNYTGDLNGTWTLEVFNYDTKGNTTAGIPYQGQIRDFSLSFSSSGAASSPSGIATTEVTGALGNSFGRGATATPNGIGPGMVLAIDNTLGTQSPHQGRIYAAYVGYFDGGTNSYNPAANTDIHLAYSDNGGLSWNQSFTNNVHGAVNDDNADTDGYSSAANQFGNIIDYTFGRTQFQPAIAVDQATGTLVVSWRDARNDAANARVATYVTTSIDGGQTFSPQTYANPDQTAVDAITRATDVMGPQADNQSSGNPQTDKTFGFGDQMGLAAFDGHLYPIWAGNLNQSYWDSGAGAVVADPLNILYRPMVYAAGPRILSGTMGLITYQEAQVGSDSINVTFDRPITASTFTTNNVQVYFRAPGSTTLVPLQVTGVSPSSGLATNFLITFNTTPAGVVDTSNYDYTGTYSYLITPDDGQGHVISSPIGSYNRIGGTLRYQPSIGMDQNADGTSDQNPLSPTQGSFTGTSPGDIYAIPTPSNTTASYSNVASILRTSNLDSTTLPIMVPGPHVTDTSVPGASTSGGTLVVNGTTSSLNVTFDRPMQVSSFTAADIQQIMGPAGLITGPQYFPSDQSGPQTIPAATAPSTPGVLTSTLTIPSFGGTFQIGHISVSLSAAIANDSNLGAVLIAPDGTQIPLFSGVGGNGSNFVNTVFDDSALTGIASGTAPFTGSFKPASPLSDPASQATDLYRHTVDLQSASKPGLWLPGVWTLQLTNAGSVKGTLDNWALNITPYIADPVPVNPQTIIVNGQSMGVATQYTINFPRQQLSGTYTVQLGPNILDQFGEGLDTNQNAGLAALRGQASGGATTTASYTSGVSQPITSTTSSTITVPDSFVISGDRTADNPPKSVMQVQLDLQYPTDSDLTATLEHYDSGGALLGSVTLFSGVGGGTNTANFNSTVFDDNATTPIQLGSAPFFATFSPQEPLAGAFAPPAGQDVNGTWVLTITNASQNGTTGTLRDWTLSFQKPVTPTGLGEAGSDNYSASFRIFTLGQTDATSSQQWTAVGPAAIGGGSGTTGGVDPSGRTTGLATDPSDPSGNTVYAGGASGGVWKTTNFLNPNGGPTWIPLTNFGPANGVDVGGIAVFGRNHDTNQSVVVVATGEGDTASPGVGFLISTDGGATWNLADSTNNSNDGVHFSPISASTRDRTFVGDYAFNVVVDPEPTPSGGVIIFASMSGPTGGIWRSEDTGLTWKRVKAGPATSVALAAGSGNQIDPITGTYVNGNLQVVYAAFQGDGIYMSPNQGQIWNKLPGNLGDTLLFDSHYAPNPNLTVGSGNTPNGGQGRITLAVPAATNQTVQDDIYQGWLYALVSTPDPSGVLYGVFVTKDFGYNWTEVNIPTETTQNFNQIAAIPTNDIGSSDYAGHTLNNYSVIGNARAGQGNYNQAIAVDPLDPSVIYIGGTHDYNQAGLIRIDLTTIWDAHALVASSSEFNDGGKVSMSSTAPATIPDLTEFHSPGSYLNFIRDPNNIFLNSAVKVYNYSGFLNNGSGVTWVPFDGGGTDYHKIITSVDPTTGLPRLILGNDQGIWTILDQNGVPQAEERNGNLQITQFYYGAAQPSSAAALIAGSLFYGSAQDNGGPRSAGDVLSSGNIVWGNGGGDAGGVATDPQGSGTVYQYFWPCCGGNDTEFFTVNGSGRTYGLIQQHNGLPTPDPQWPAEGTINFAVNPVNNQDIVISSDYGRIFTTTNQGVNWFEVGDETLFGLSATTNGQASLAMAYGAPDPTAPFGVGNLGYFIYVGTAKGGIYVTQDGGGSGTSNDWINISNGLKDNSKILQIITDPTRGKHDAYAVTATHVYYIADSIPSATNTPTWVDITGNLKNLAYSIFGQSYDPTKDSSGKPYSLANAFSSIAADWRYAIPNDPKDASKGYHPALYVGANAAVYQSLDGGQTWTLFPDTSYGALVQGGNLPHDKVRSLSLSLGNLNASTGRSTLIGPYQPAISLIGTLSIGSALVTGIADTTGLAVGDLVSGAGLPAGTKITSITPSTKTTQGRITLSNTSTVAGSKSLSALHPTIAFDGMLTAGSNVVTGVADTSALFVGELISGAGLPAGDTIVAITPSAPGTPGRLALASAASGAGPQHLVASTITGDPDTLMAATYGQGEFAINLAPQIVGNSVTVKGATAGPGSLPAVNGPITISGTSEITAAGNATWITIEDITDPSNPRVIAGFNPFNGIPKPDATNSTNALGQFAIQFDPEAFYGLHTTGTKTIAIFATDNAGSIGNLVKYTFALNPPTGLAFLPQFGPGGTLSLPASARAGDNFAADPNNVVVQLVDAAGDVLTNFETGPLGSVQQVSIPLTIALAPGETGTFDPNSILTADAVNGVATFDNLAIDTAGTFTLEVGGGPVTLGGQTLTLTPGDSTPIQIVPNDPAKLACSTEPPSTVTEYYPFSGSVQVTDRYGNLVTATTDVTLSLLDPNGQPDAADLSVTDPQTSVDGVATFGDITINNIGDPYTLVASSAGLTSASSDPIDVRAPVIVPGNGVPNPTPVTTTAGDTFSLTFTALTYDQTAVVTGFDQKTMTLSINTGPAGAVLKGTTTATAAAGIATFGAVELDIAGTYDLIASSGNLTVGHISVTVVPAAATGLLIVQQPPTSVVAGVGFGFQVGAQDKYGNPTALTGGVTVAIQNNPGNTTLNGVLTATAAGGVAKFSNLSLNKTGVGYTLLVTSTTLASTTSGPITVTPAAMTQIVIPADGEPPAAVNAGQAFSMTVDAEDQYGNIVTGFTGPVTVSSTATLFGTTALNAADGVATFDDLSFHTVGTYRLQAQTPSLQAPVTTSSVTVNPDPTPGLLFWATQPKNPVVQGVGFPAVIDVEDQYGNLETGFNGPVTLALIPDGTGAVLQGTKVVTASGGVATFLGLSVDKADPSAVLSASIAGGLTTNSNAFDVQPIVATGIKVDTQPPATVQATDTFGLVVDVVDQAGRTDPYFNGTVTVAISGPSGGSILVGTKSVTAASGVATFDDLGLTLVGNYTLLVSSTGLPSASTGTINVIAGSATQLVMVTQPPASLTAGDTFGFQVKAEDRYGNLATAFNSNLTASLSSGTTLHGSTTAAASGGMATFSGLSVYRAGTGYTITAGGTGLTSVTTASFNVSPAAASQVVVSTQPPPSVTAGSPFGLSVAVADPYGNVVSTYGGSVGIQLATAPAGATLGGTLAANLVNGAATFPGLSLKVAASNYTIQATTAGLSPTTTNAIAVTPAAATQLVVTIPPPSRMFAGAQFGMSVAAEDKYGNPNTQFNGNVTIGFAANPTGAPLLGGPFTVKAVNGVAAIPSNGMEIDVAGTGYVLQGTAAGLTPAVSGSITVVAGPATHLVVLTEPPAVVVSGVGFGLVVAGEDAYGNVATGFSGPVSLSTPGGSGIGLSGNTTVTAGQGLATFTGLVLGQTGNSVALSVASPGLDGTVTTSISQSGPTVVSFAVGSVQVAEDSGQALIQVNRSGGYQGAVTVRVQTAGGTATPGVNYTAVDQTFTLGAGQSSQIVAIPIKNAGPLASNPSILLQLSSLDANAVVGSQSTATIQILNAGQSVQGSSGGNGGSNGASSGVALEGVQVIKRGRRVEEIVLSFSGALDPAEASNIAEFSLIRMGKHHSFTAPSARHLPIRSVVYNPANHTVTITPRRLVLGKPVEVVANGLPPTGLRDGSGNLLGRNLTGILTRGGGSVSSAVVGSAAVDQLVVLGELPTFGKQKKH